MRRAVIDQDDVCGQRESASDDLDEQDGGEGGPDEGAGCLGGRGAAAGDNGEVGG